MPRSGRRRFLGLVGGAAAVSHAGGAVEAQAPPKTPLGEADSKRRALAAALRELNAKAGLGVTVEDFDRAEAYVTGALLAAQTKLRSLPLPDTLDLPVVHRRAEQDGDEGGQAGRQRAGRTHSWMPADACPGRLT